MTVKLKVSEMCFDVQSQPLCKNLITKEELCDFILNFVL